MDLRTIAFFAKIKGLNVVGTGDILHPRWFGESSEILRQDGDSGLYLIGDKPDLDVRFMITTEVSTVYVQGGRSRKVHHCLLMPSLEVAAQVADLLKAFGDLSIDGRPILNVSSPELVEQVMSISKLIEIFPAHAWTPWWSIFGSISGFDSLDECYQDQVRYIHALETGLSSDPPMNWRLSRLDRYTLLSNSDCHSPYPHRLGREANVFNVPRKSYFEFIDAIRSKDPRRLLHTIETKPEYGKYHWTGHRQCNVSLSPQEALSLNNKCPKCGRPLTRGVEQRVEQLADRPRGFVSENAPFYHYLLPLHELVAAVLGETNPLAGKVQRLYAALIDACGSEFAASLNAPLETIEKATGKDIANAIKEMREDTLKVVPGYDGVYGRIEIPSIADSHSRKPQSKQRTGSLEEYESG